ncbi:hypothetical protein NE857_09360 [Nocardiopsis exhalans]|uniref:CMP/dCMP-type deaminase domain-containing protein n=1 Tax=Nocardiopsis exhalans TaxID=163604 RepID=A0ABY5DEI9_9ACTN|nr:hypothetical protein [Nocardiopsis exhalans]USY21789.1 hypothetical protein NE857_09360 [Nocardiopsis exhalans]
MTTRIRQFAEYEVEGTNIPIFDTPTEVPDVLEDLMTENWPYLGTTALAWESDDVAHLYIQGVEGPVAKLDSEDLEGLIPQALNLLSAKRVLDMEIRANAIAERAERLHASPACVITEPRPCSTCRDYATALVDLGL